MHTVVIGSFSLPVGYAMLIIAFLLALIVGAVTGRNNKSLVFNTLFDMLWLGVLVARLGFVLLYIEHYRDNLWSIINFRDGGLNIWFGLLGAGAMLVYKLIKKPALRQAIRPALLVGGLSYGAMFAFVTLINTSTPPIPDVSVLTLNGDNQRLLDIVADRPVVINLWASWCPPCVREMPVLAQAQANHPEVAFIFANQGENYATIETFLSQNALDIDNVVLDIGYHLGQEAGSVGLPTTLFYNADGQRVHVHIGELSTATIARGMEYF